MSNNNHFIFIFVYQWISFLARILIWFFFSPRKSKEFICGSELEFIHVKWELRRQTNKIEQKFEDINNRCFVRKKIIFLIKLCSCWGLWWSKEGKRSIVNSVSDQSVFDPVFLTHNSLFLSEMCGMDPQSWKYFENNFIRNVFLLSVAPVWTEH